MGIKKHGQTRIAIIGAGVIAREHLLAFRDLENILIVGISAPTSARSHRLAEEFDIKIICNDVKTLWEKTRADAVVVAVPILNTYEVCEDVFVHDWISLVEKPIGYNLAEAAALASLASAKSHQCFIALNRRHFGSTLHLKNLLTANTSNRIIRVNDQEDQAQGVAAGHPTSVIQNWHFANSIHLIDYFLQFGRGKISRVTREIKHQEARLSHVSAEIEFSSGDKGFYEAIWNAPARWSVQVELDSLIAELKPLEQARITRKGSQTDELPIDSLDKNFKPGFKRQAELFINQVRGDSTQNKLPTLSDSLETMRLIDMIYGSPEISQRTINI